MTRPLFYSKSPLVQRILLSALILTLPVRAQEPHPKVQTPTFRAASNTVLLDLVVTDKKNRLVNGLSRDDFVVYENDVVQQIQSFQIGRQEVQGPAGKSATRGEPVAQPASREPDAPASKPNFIVFLMDYSTTEFENQKLVQDAALHYVENRLGPNDLVAVFFLGTGFRFLQDFTGDRARLAAVLRGRDVTATGLAQGSGVQPLSAAQSSAVADASSLAVSSGSGPGAGQSAMAAGAQAAANAQYFINARIQAALSSMRSAISSRTARGVLAAIEAISHVVAPITGRKTMVLFSQGFVVGPHMEPELARAVDAANKANVAVYTIDSAGLAPRDLSTDLIPQDRLSGISARAGRGRIPASGGESLFDRARTAGNDSHESSLRYVAAATGGLAFRNTNDLSISLDRVAEDIHSHYVLSYQPINQEFDGAFRNIRVEVKKPGLSVRTRSGYYAIPPGMEGVTGEEYRLLSQTRKGGGATLPFDTALGSFPGAGGLSRVSITIELSAREVSFQESEGSKVAAIAIIGLLRGEDGYVFSRVGAPVNIKASPEEFKALQQGSLSFTNSIEAPPGHYSFEVLVRDQNSGKAAIRDYSLTVAPLSTSLTASSIVLSSEIKEAREAPVDDYLSFGKIRVLPSARRQFRNGDNLVYLFCVYNAKLSAQKRANLEIRTAFERLGTSNVLKLPNAHVEDASDGPIPYVPVARYVALNGLVAGRYFLSVEIEDLESKEICRSRTPFEILP
jgi:VWFA-related protein